MRVIVDAHLPKRLAEILSALEIESKHTLDLPKKNATPDHEIIQIADREDRLIA